MKRTTTTLFWLARHLNVVNGTWTCIFALTMLACGGGNPGNDGVEPDVANDNSSDVVDNDCNNCAEADTTDDEQTAPDNDTPDSEVYETTMPTCDPWVGCAASATTIYRCNEETLLCELDYCTEDLDCDQELGQWCDKYIQSCRPEGILSLLEPYRFLEGSWQRMDGSGQKVQLELLGWNEETQSAEIKLSGWHLTFKYNGEILLLTQNLQEGDPPVYNIEYQDLDADIISYDRDPEGEYHVIYEQW